MTRYLSVCSGIEAASVAFHPLGWKPLAFSEIEAFPSAVLAHHYPTVPNLGDMTKWKSWDWEILGDTDVLVGGPPCQAFSVAGLRAGLDDERGQLTISYIHLLDHIDEIRSLYGKEPAICLYENVPGILSSKDNAFGAFLAGLAGEDCELVPSGGKWTDAGCVYGPKRSVAWRVLDAQYFGVAQRRKRVFVIASARDIDPSEILFEFDGVRRDTPPSRETGKAVTEAVGGCSTEQSYSIIDDPTPKVGDDICLTMRSQGGGGIVPPSVAFLDRASFNQGVNAQYEPEITYPATSSSTLVARGSHAVCIPIHDKATRHGGERGVSNGLGIGSPSDPCPTLDTGGNHAVAIQGSMIGRDDKNGQQGDGLNEEVSFTLNCVDRHAVATTMQVRRLTPTECERLQGFPRNWTDVLYRNKPAADDPRYKSLGNSMATPVMHWLGRRINDALIRLGH